MTNKAGSLLIVIVALLMLAPAASMGDVLPLTPVIDCSKSTITAEKLIERLHAIINHGDLSDVPFLEKTLQVKFVPHNMIVDGKPNIQRTVYKADSPWNIPVSIWFDVNIIDQSNRTAILARLTISGQQKYLDSNDPIQRCLKVLPQKLADSFGGNFHLVSEDRSINASKNLGRVGKNNYVFNIDYGYFDSSPIYYLNISQTP